MAKDLRMFLQELRHKLPEEIVEIEREVDPAWEMGAVIQKFEEREQYPLLIFRRPKGNPYPVITNIFASRRRCAFALGSTPEHVAQDYWDRLRHPIAPVKIPAGQAPCKEVVEVGEQVNLLKFPVLTHHEWDAGPYLTASMVTLKWHGKDAYNTGLHRCWVKARNRMGVFFSPGKHNWHIHKENDLQGKKTRVVTWFGHHPQVYFGAQARGPFDVDEYSYAGGFTGEPLRLAPSETWGDEFLVPADAEIVIEGEILPGVEEVEAPFGEYTRYYGEQRYNPVIEVTAVTHRKDCYFHDLYVSHADNHIMGGFPLEARVFDAVRSVVPGVKNVYLPLAGCCRFWCFIQIRKRTEGEGKLALTAAMPADSRIKYFVVVDDDVNVTHEKEVLWAIATRTQFPDDLFIVTNTIGEALDPMAEENHLVNKMGIDATRPMRPFAERVAIPPDVLERVRLENLIPMPILKEIPTERM
ncbi:MAG: UbiD family decarboxylase [Deltaproteobacteria bacterium]|nr:UbiD family decarboxylase [Deltaproteobacteria bacterium]